MALDGKQTDESAGPALGYWVKEGVRLVVHFPPEDVAKINTPWPWQWPWPRVCLSVTSRAMHEKEYHSQSTSKHKVLLSTKYF